MNQNQNLCRTIPAMSSPPPSPPADASAGLLRAVEVPQVSTADAELRAAQERLDVLWRDVLEVEVPGLAMANVPSTNVTDHAAGPDLPSASPPQPPQDRAANDAAAVQEVDAEDKEEEEDEDEDEEDEWAPVVQPKKIPLSVSEQLYGIKLLENVYNKKKDARVLPRTESWDKDRFVRFVCISDTHNRHRSLGALPKGDVLLHTGDISIEGKPKNLRDFAEWFAAQPFKEKVVIPGNHDLSLEDRFAKSFPDEHQEAMDAMTSESFRMLINESLEVEGYKIWGSPTQPFFCDWAFQLGRGPALWNEWSKIPADTDILMTHGPPAGYGDLCRNMSRGGCIDLLHHVQQRVHPLVHIFGHIHENAGVWDDGVTLFVNASSCDIHYKAVHAPIVFDLPRKKL